MQQVTNNIRVVKQTNVNLVKSTLRELGKATKAEIALKTGLSISTCGNVIRFLLDEGIVKEGQLDTMSAGRPSRVFEFDVTHKLGLCLTFVSDEEVHIMDYAVVDLQGSAVERDEIRGKEINIEDIYSLVDRMREKYDSICIVGIGIPGLALNGRVKYCDVSSLDGLNLKELISERYDNMNVVVANEMHLKAYGYYKSHEELEGENFAVLNAPRGYIPGASFVVNGKILKGSTNLSGEINYMPYAASKQDIINKMKEEKTFVQLMTDYVIAIMTTINPSYLLFAGLKFEEHHIEKIKRCCLERVPEEHFPKILFQPDISTEYLNGLAYEIVDYMTSQEKIEIKQ